MKNKLKKFLLLFGVISTILVACNFDETHDHFHSENGKKSNFKIQKVKSEIFSKNTQLIGKLNTNKQLLKSIDSNNRIITSSDNSFYINTEEATYIEEENGLHSYTFFINRNLDNVFLENLLISSQEDGTYKSFIVRYNISAQEVEDLKNGINIDTNNRISIEIIDDVNFTQGISNKIIYTPCVTGTNKFWQCSNNVAGHMPGNPGPPRCSADSFSYVINVQWGLCASDDGTMDDISGGGGSSDGGGGGTTGGNDSNYDGSDPNIHGNGGTPINTAPIIEEEINDPCTNASPAIANANTLFNSPEVQQGMNDVLIQKINEEGQLPFIDQREWGVAIGQSGTTLNVTAPRRGSATQGSIPSSQVSGNYIADGHNHPNWGYADPSGLDLYGMLNLVANTSSFKYRFVFGVSYPSRQTTDTYILIVTDSNAAQAFLNQFPEIQNTNASTHDFKEDTKLGDDYFKAKDLSYVGYSQNLTDELYVPGAVGLAYILDKYNSGICIAKKDANGNFKKINATLVTKTNANGVKYNEVIISKCQ